MMDCTARTVGGSALLAVRAVTAFFPARSPRVSMATAFLSRGIFCGSTRLLLQGLLPQEDFKRKSTCSFNKFALSATERLCLRRPLYLLHGHLQVTWS